MANRRIFYAIQQVGMAPLGTADYRVLHGVQSVGINTTFNLEQVFELGQLELYENIENVPDIEVTIEKVLDGHIPSYLLATSGSAGVSLTGRSALTPMVALSIFTDIANAASGDALREVEMSGMFVSSLNYTFPVDGNSTESVTLVGNNKKWLDGAAINFDGKFTNAPNDAPLAAGGVQRRENVDMANTGVDVTTGGASLWPTDIPGISSSGTNNNDGNSLGAHIQTTSVATDLGRDELFELGRRGPYHRFINFPVEVTCAIEITSLEGDLVNALESPASNVGDETIRVVTDSGLTLNLGVKNKLQSITYGGGDAGGGNVTTSFNYSNFNALSVSHTAHASA